MNCLPLYAGATPFFGFHPHDPSMNAATPYLQPAFTYYPSFYAPEAAALAASLGVGTPFRSNNTTNHNSSIDNSSETDETVVGNSLHQYPSPASVAASSSGVLPIAAQTPQLGPAGSSFRRHHLSSSTHQQPFNQPPLADQQETPQQTVQQQQTPTHTPSTSTASTGALRRRSHRPRSPVTPYRTPRHAASISQRQAQSEPQRRASVVKPSTPSRQLSQQQMVLPVTPVQQTAQSFVLQTPRSIVLSTSQQQVLPQTMAQPTPQAQAEAAALVAEIEPTGPLVGPLQPSSAITAEYAAADPVYRVKTAALPLKYSHYRTVRGDGKCGWRAIAFGYFESLIRMNSVKIFTEEENRMVLLRSVVQRTGPGAEFCEEFFDEALELLRKLAVALPNGTAESELLETFNDDGVQQYLVFCMKLLTAAEIKTHEADYAPYMETETVDQFCDYIRTVDSEIDHRSLNALHAILLSPIDMALEVLYLDRSEGAEVNAHRWDTLPGVSPVATVRLLYRPGHYDILYQHDGVSSAPVSAFLQYNSPYNHFPDISSSLAPFAPGFAYDMADEATALLMRIPGMSYLPTPPDGWLSMGDATLLPCAPALVNNSSLPDALPALAPPASTPLVSPQDLNLQSLPTFVPTDTLGAAMHGFYHRPAAYDLPPPPVQLPFRPVEFPAPATAPTSLPKPAAAPAFRDPFRKSSVQHQHERDMRPSAAARPPPLLTKPMQQSPCSEAHYFNAEFQPITYDPQNPKASDLQDGSGARGGRRKSQK